MKKTIIYLIILVLFVHLISAQEQTKNETSKIYLSEGYYFVDKEQTKLYTGTYREYYENGTLRLEIQIKDGLPQGSTVVYFENRRPNEVRTYDNGQLHGLWRKYDISGQLISEAEYFKGKKHGTWRVWDELGILRYETMYDQGKRIGMWRMWDENGKLVDERKY